MSGIMTPTVLRFWTNAGVPLAGGKVYTYVAGTTTPKTVYKDSALSVSHTNPITLDANGSVGFAIFGTGTYKIDVKDSAGASINGFPIDNVELGADSVLSALAASSGSSLVGFIHSGTGATARTAQSKMRDFVSIADFGATEASSDNAQNIQAAFDAHDCIYIPEGVYKTSLVQPNRSKVVIRGPGTLRLKQGEFSEIILIGSATTFIDISGVVFEGNKSNTTATDPALRKRLLNASSPNAFAVVDSCIFHGGNYGGMSIDGKRITITNNYVYDCGYAAGVGDGISVVSYLPDRISITNNTVIDAADYGIAVDAVNAVISGNYVKGALSAGIGSLARGATGPYADLGINIKCTGNTVIDCVNPMEFFCSPSENTSGFIGLDICDNYISGGTATNPAIFVTRNSGGYEPAGTKIRVDGNTVRCYSAIAQGIGVTGQGTAWATSDISISGNMVDTVKGIVITGLKNVSIVGNILRPTASGDRGVVSSTCKQVSISGNIFDGFGTAIHSEKSSLSLFNNTYVGITSTALKAYGGDYIVNEVYSGIAGKTVILAVHNEASAIMGNVSLSGSIAFYNCGTSGSYAALHIADPSTDGTIKVRLDSLTNSSSGTLSLCPYILNNSNANIRFEVASSSGINLSGNPENSNVRISSGSPSLGAWNAGDIVKYSAPVSAGYMGSVCTVAGSPGTWKTFGLVS